MHVAEQDRLGVKAAGDAWFPNMTKLDFCHFFGGRKPHVFRAFPDIGRSFYTSTFSRVLKVNGGSRRRRVPTTRANWRAVSLGRPDCLGTVSRDCVGDQCRRVHREGESQAREARYLHHPHTGFGSD